MKLLLLTFSFFVFSQAMAQTNMQYAAAKAGLSLRQLPAATAPVLQKIAYGQKLQLLTDTAAGIKIITEGFEGYWQKVKYNNEEGYVVSSYLLPAAPPKLTVKNIKDYLAQISTAAGPAVTVTKGNRETMEDNFSEIKKQLYKNGAEYHQTQWYESNAATFFLPGFSIEQAFLLVRLIGCYENEVGNKQEFPVKNSTVKLPNGTKTITVERYKWPDVKQPPVNKVIVETEDGPVSTLEIFMIDGQAVISWGSGV